MDPSLKILHLLGHPYQDEGGLWFLDILLEDGGEVEEYRLGVPLEEAAREIEQHFLTSVLPLTGEDLMEIAYRLTEEPPRSKPHHLARN